MKSGTARDPLSHYERAAIANSHVPCSTDSGYRDYLRERQQRMRRAVEENRWQRSGWGESFTQQILHALQASRVFVDVGAESGFYSLLADSQMPSDARIVAIEPDPYHCELLRELCVDGCHRIEVVEAAASDCEGQLTLFRARGCSATAAPVAQDSFQVQTVSLDQLLGDIDVDVVKIDVEGAEAGVLRGMRGILARRRVRVFLEWHPWAEMIEPGAAASIANDVKSAGYRMVRLDGGDRVRVERPRGRLCLEPDIDHGEPEASR